MPRSGPSGARPPDRPPRQRPVVVLSEQQQSRRRLGLLAAFAVVGILAVALTSGGGDKKKDEKASDQRATSTTAGGDGDGTPSRNQLVPGLSVVTLRGLGPVVAGMTIDEASKAAGVDFESEGEGEGESDCRYVRPKIPSGDISFMVTRNNAIDTIARVDVEGPGFKTRSGAGVGDTEERVKQIYPNRIEVQPHEYVAGGHYLVYKAESQADSAFSLIFETDGKTVTRFRSGRKPEVAYVEGCS